MPPERPSDRVATAAGAGRSTHHRPEGDTVDEVKTWTVSIDIGEHEGRTRAVAHLHTRDTEGTVGVGFARLNPSDQDVPEIGDEIAVARALSDLSRRLLHVAAEDVEQMSGEPAHLTM
jgi:hypothetical protein